MDNRVVEAERFRVMGPSGRPAAELYCNEHGGELILYDLEGRPRVTLGATTVGWALGFLAEHGGRHAVLEATQAGSALLLFSGLAEGLEEAHVSLTADVEGGKGTGAVALRDSRHLRRIVLGFHSPCGEPIVACGDQVEPLAALLAR